MQNYFDKNKFVPFSTSSGLDGSYTGLYENKVVRVVEKNKEHFKKILHFSNEITGLIKSKLLYEEENILVIEHEKLEYITYYEEWTKKQKVNAAKTVVDIQLKLVAKGFYLNDPHAFNITFKYHQPLYFDFGSIKTGKITPSWWFVKCFCGWTEMDYWDSVLKINIIQKLWITLRMFFSKLPYVYLLKKLSKFETGFIEKKLIKLLRMKNSVGKITKKLVISLPLLFRNFSNWTDYDQKNPELNFDNDRNRNILELFRRFKPKNVLDIGANKGAYSFLALENGTKEAIALDLDSYSLNHLLNEIAKHNSKITVAKLNIMNYPDKPGYYGSYIPSHKRFNCDFTICLAVVHHLCYFGNYSFEEFAERLNRFANNTLIVEFVPYDDIHLTGTKYKDKDRSWYTEVNFIKVFKRWFPGDHEIFKSTPSPRILIKFCK